MKEKLFKTGLKKTDRNIRKFAITASTVTIISAAIFLPLTISMTLNAPSDLVQTKTGINDKTEEEVLTSTSDSKFELLFDK